MLVQLPCYKEASNSTQFHPLCFQTIVYSFTKMPFLKRELYLCLYSNILFKQSSIFQTCFLMAVRVVFFTNKLVFIHRIIINALTCSCPKKDKT